MAYNAIEITGAVKHFGATRAVDGVDLTVRPGELFGLIGHNGAGKTTLFKMMLGLLAPNRGDIRVDGQAVHGATFREVRRRIGYLPESLALYDNLSGLEIMQFFARLKNADLRSCWPLLEKVGLAGAARRRVRGYSKGMRQRLGFAQALLGTPHLLFLDEPTNGLDPQGIREFYQILRELREQGVTAILSSHILAEIQLRVDRLALMKTGKIQALGTVRELREALNLPLDWQVTLSPDAVEPLRAALAEQPGVSLKIVGDIAHIRCPRPQKMAVFERLATLGLPLLDFELREPSLEDVFLGYSDTTA